MAVFVITAVPTVEGFLRSSGGPVYAAEQAGAGSYFDAAFPVDVGQDWFPGTYIIYRSGLAFDTSPVGAGSPIVSAVLSLYGWNDFSDTDFDLTVVSGADLADPLVDADYQELLARTASFGSMNTSAFILGDWNNIALNASGRAAINLIGITFLGLRSSRDIAALVPGGSGFESIQYETPNNVVWPATHRPILTITTAIAPTVQTDPATGVN